MIPVGWPLESVLKGCQLTRLPASLKVRCGHVMSFPPVGSQEGVVWRFPFWSLRPYIHLFYIPFPLPAPEPSMAATQA